MISRLIKLSLAIGLLALSGCATTPSKQNFDKIIVGRCLNALSQMCEAIGPLGAPSFVQTQNIASGVTALSVLGTPIPGDCTEWANPATLEDAGAPCGSGGGTPAGANLQLQYNNSGAFGAITNGTVTGQVLTWTNAIGWNAQTPLSLPNLTSYTSPASTDVTFIYSQLNSSLEQIPLSNLVAANRQPFTTSGTWNNPGTAYTWTVVDCWGGGGSGASGDSGATATALSAGGGGGGGYHSHGQFSTSALPSTVSVTVPAAATGASGVTNGAGIAGSAGGTALFGTYLQAFGGGGGGAGASGSNSIGGAGGNLGATGASGNTSAGQGAGGGGSGGNGNGAVYPNGGSGGGGDTAGSAGSNGANSSDGGPGGAAGGGVPTGDTETNGGNGGAAPAYDIAACAGGAGTGAAGTAPTGDGPGGGGCGGASNPTGTGFTGGAGAVAAGGGGGGATESTHQSGGGGNGGAPYCVAVSR